MESHHHIECNPQENGDSERNHCSMALPLSYLLSFLQRLFRSPTKYQDLTFYRRKHHYRTTTFFAPILEQDVPNLRNQVFYVVEDSTQLAWKSSLGLAAVWIAQTGQDVAVIYAELWKLLLKDACWS